VYQDLIREVIGTVGEPASVSAPSDFLPRRLIVVCRARIKDAETVLEFLAAETSLGTPSPPPLESSVVGLTGTLASQSRSH
jgi:hypothetical protein